MATAPQSAAGDSSPCYRWEPADKNICVYLSYEAANRILSEAIRGLGLVPRRGAEIGGILLGTVETGERRVIRIEAVLPVASEHAFGPSWVLSKNDQRTLAGALAQPPPEHAPQVVGFYRSHTRKGLALGAEDLEVLSAYFPEPFQLALLVKPHAMRPSLGGFFFREEGTIRSESSYLEFPLSMTPARRPPLADEPAEPAPEALSTPEIALPSFLQAPAKRPGRLRAWWRQRRDRPKQPRAARGGPLWSSWWVQVPLMALLLSADGTIGYVVAQRYPIRLPAVTAQEDPYSLRLVVVEYGNNLHLSWNRSAPAITQARRAMLTIVDGEQNRTLELAPPQLLSGSVIYRRLTPRVKFRLEVFVRDRESVAETWELKAGSEAGGEPAR